MGEGGRMNIRLSKQSVRFRISKDEFNHLMERGELVEETWFPSGCLRYTVSRGAHPSIGLRENEVSLTVSQDQIESLSRSLGSKNAGICLDTALTGGRTLQANLEVDLFSVKEGHSRHRSHP